jgi:hypothetical protein
MTVRVLRIIEYVGEEKWLRTTLLNSSVPLDGEMKAGEGNYIRSAMVGGVLGFTQEVDLHGGVK